MVRIKCCHLLSLVFSFPRRQPLRGCQSQTPAVSLYQNKRPVCVCVHVCVCLHVCVRQYLRDYVFFCNGSSCSDTIIFISKLVGVVACITCFTPFAFLEERDLLSLHVLFQAHSASRWTHSHLGASRCIQINWSSSVISMFAPWCVCVCPDWLVGQLRGRGRVRFREAA